MATKSPRLKALLKRQAAAAKARRIAIASAEKISSLPHAQRIRVASNGAIIMPPMTAAEFEEFKSRKGITKLPHGIAGVPTTAELSEGDKAKIRAYEDAKEAEFKLNGASLFRSV